MLMVRNWLILCYQSLNDQLSADHLNYALWDVLSLVLYYSNYFVCNCDCFMDIVSDAIAKNWCDFCWQVNNFAQSISGHSLHKYSIKLLKYLLLLPQVSQHFCDPPKSDECDFITGDGLGPGKAILWTVEPVNRGTSGYGLVLTSSQLNVKRNNPHFSLCLLRKYSWLNIYFLLRVAFRNISSAVDKLKCYYHWSCVDRLSKTVGLVLLFCVINQPSVLEDLKAKQRTTAGNDY